jgi:hypothetical protein
MIPRTRVLGTSRSTERVVFGWQLPGGNAVGFQGFRR